MKLYTDLKVSKVFESAVKVVNGLLQCREGFLAAYAKLNFRYADPDLLFQVASQHGSVPIKVNNRSKPTDTMMNVDARTLKGRDTLCIVLSARFFMSTWNLEIHSDKSASCFWLLLISFLDGCIRILLTGLNASLESRMVMSADLYDANLYTYIAFSDVFLEVYLLYKCSLSAVVKMNDENETPYGLTRKCVPGEELKTSRMKLERWKSSNWLYGYLCNYFNPFPVDCFNLTSNFAALEDAGPMRRREDMEKSSLLVISPEGNGLRVVFDPTGKRKF